MEKLKFLVSSLFFIVCFFSSPLVVHSQNNSPVDVIINFNGDVDYSLLNSYGAEVVFGFKNINSVYATIPTQNINALSKSIKINSISENRTISLNGTLNNELPLSPEEIKFYNENKNYAQDKMNIQEAWNVGLSGKGIKIAVVDTGIDINNSEVTPINSISFVTETNGDNSVQDYDGHGTSIASLIAGTHSNELLDGVAPSAEIYVAKALNSSGEGLYTDIIRAIDWSIEQKVNIINLSLGSPMDDVALHNAILAAKNNNIIVVAGAGNSGNPDPNINTIQFPAKYAQSIAVGSTDLNNGRARFTNTYHSASGAELDFVSPGVYNLSLGLNGKYIYSSGTSNSAALVSGLIALYLESDKTISTNNIYQILQNSSQDLGTVGKDDAFGGGLVKFASKASTNNTTSSFSDVPNNHWAINSINFAKNNDLMIGKNSYSTFLPSDFLNRAEAASIFNRLLNQTSIDGFANPYSDVPNDHWAFNEIVIAFKYNTLSGYEDNTFKPGNNITRAEVASILSRILTKTASNNGVSLFSDVPNDHWAINSIHLVGSSKAMTGYEDGSFKPSNNITRAEMASILERIFNSVNKK